MEIMSQINYTDWTKYLDDLPEFVSRLSLEDKSRFSKLLKDKVFREYIIKVLPRSKWGNIMQQLTPKTVDDLFDDEFFVTFFSECPEVEKKLSYIAVWLNDDVKKSMVNKPYFYHYLIENVQFTETFMGWARTNIYYQTRFKILHYCLEENQYSYDVLAILQDTLYPEEYVLEYERDYSANAIAIKDINQLLANEKIFSIYFKNFKLLSSLAPENLTFIYSKKSFSNFDKDDIDNLFKLIENGYEFTLPSSIYLDQLFINEAISIYPIERFRKIVLHLGVKNKDAISFIQKYRNQEYDRIIQAFLSNKINQDNYDLNRVKQIIFDRYFAASPHDTFLMASGIYDTMNTLPSFDGILTKRGHEIIQVLVDELQYELKSKPNEAEGMNSLNNIASLEDVKNLKNMCVKLQNLWPNDEKISLAENFAALFKKSREFFNRHINETLYKPAGTATKILPNGVKVYDITDTNFHCLVHAGQVPNESEELFAPIPNGGHNINISMSLLGRNKLETYDGEVILGYSKVDDGAVMHALNMDSFTLYSNRGKVEKYSFAHAVTQYMPTYIDVDSFMSLTCGYNEIKIKATPNTINKNGQKIFKADYVLCKTTITKTDIEIASKYNLPIVYIDERKINAERAKEMNKSTQKRYIPIIYRIYPRLNLADTSFENDRVLL